MTSRRISETGWVSDVRDDSVEIRLRASAACARCGLCDRKDGPDASIVVRAQGPFSVGQAVRVTFPYSSVWKQTLVVFTLPLVAILAFGAAGWLLAGLAGCTEATAGVIGFLSAALGLALGLWHARGFEKRFRARMWGETIVESLGQADAASCESETGA